MARQQNELEIGLVGGIPPLKRTKRRIPLPPFPSSDEEEDAPVASRRKRKKKKRGGFRCQGKNFFLSVIVPAGTKADVVLAYYRKAFPREIVSYTITIEICPETGATHFHALFGFNSSWDCRNPDFLHYRVDGKTYKGNYQIPRSIIACKKYCEKEETAIERINNDKSDDTFKELVRISQEKGIMAAKKFLIVKDPKNFAINWTRMKPALESIAPEIVEALDYHWEDFVAPEKPVPPLLHPWHWWIEGGKQSTALWVLGKTGQGKTAFIKAWAEKEGIPYLVVTHKDCLKGFRADYHKLVVYDDCDFKKMDPNMALQMTGVKAEKRMDVKHSSVVVPAGVFMVFLSNGPIWPTNEPALSRRICCWTNESDLRKEGRTVAQENPFAPTCAVFATSFVFVEE